MLDLRAWYTSLLDLNRQYLQTILTRLHFHSIIVLFLVITVIKVIDI
jgi:hypothetical protein